jgi:N-acyl-D-amino-acid deacylase
MEAGALGLSTGLEYDPGSFASTDELVELARAAASHGGIYASHVRNEDQYIWAAIDETIDIGRQAQIPVRVTHIKLAISRWWGQADRLKRKLDDARAAGIDITADIYPYRAWYAGFGWFATLFPDRDLTQRAGAEYILNDMLAPDRIVIPVYKPNPAYNNLSIAEIADLRGDDPETTLMALLQEDAELDSEGSGSETLAFAMDEPDIESIMAWPHTVIASDGGSTGAHPRGYNTFSRFLGHYVRDRQVVSLEQGVRKITALPAEQVGISKRGSIAVGHYADLVLFNPNTIKDNATFEAPLVTAAGLEKVWVNGQVVYEDGEVTGNRPGKPLRRVNP